MKIDFFEEHRRLLEDPARSPFGEYARALEELGARLSSLAGGCLQALHASDYPFAIALRPYYYMSALQFANVKYFPQPRGDETPTLRPFDRLVEMFDTGRDDPLHGLVHRLAFAELTEKAVERLLDEVPAASIARSASRPPRELQRASPGLRLGLSLSLTGVEEAVLSLLGRGRIRLIRPRRSPGYLLNVGLRKRLLRALKGQADALPPDSAAVRVLLASAALLPTYYLEGFADHLAEASTLADSIVGLVGGTEYHHHPQIALLIPLLTARGRITVGAQHGGLYGQTDPSWHETAERFLFERYLTWGYRHTPQDVPMPVVRMSRPRIDHGMFRLRRKVFGPETSSTLVILPCIYDTLSFGTYSPSVNRQVEALRATFDILAGSGPESGSFVLRCHPRNRQVDYAEAVPDLLRERITFAQGSRGSLARDAHRYAEVVFTSPNATGITECLSNNVEFGIVADPALYHIRPEARSVYDGLIRARVWMVDSAARSDCLARPSELAGQRREALDRFAEQYALRSSGYLGQWSRFLDETYRSGLARIRGAGDRSEPA